MEVWVNKYIAPNMKIINSEKKQGLYYAYFPSGAKMAIFSHGSTEEGASFSGAFHIYVYPALSTKTKIIGKYYFTFFYHKSTNFLVEPYKFGWDGTRQSLFTGPYGCAQNRDTKHYCTTLLQFDNWEVKDDYPIKF